MEMLPESVSEIQKRRWHFHARRPSLLASSTFCPRRKLTSLHHGCLLTTDIVIEIMGIECILAQKKTYNWRESEINYFIAGVGNLIEDLIRGSAVSISVETTAETTMAANKEVTLRKVDHMGKEPVLALVTQSVLEQNSLLDVGGEAMDLETKDGQITNLLLGGGRRDEMTAGALEVTEVTQGGGSAVRTRSEIGVDNCRLFGFQRLVRVSLDSTFRSLKKWREHTSRSEGARSEAERPTQEVKRRERDPIRMSIHRWSLDTEDGASAQSRWAVRLQTSCYFSKIQLASRNLSPVRGHGREPVLISKQESHEIPAGRLYSGQGSQHGAMMEAWPGEATSIGVAGATQFVMMMLISPRPRLNHKRRYRNEEVVINRSQ